MEFWRKNKIFEKTLAKTKNKKPFVFYDGPPFATGLPHYGHFLASTIKDLIPRYYTMKGRYVPRRWGWDCHGLPIEHLIEGKLGVNSRKEILEIGLARFNQKAKESVLEYANEWERFVNRIGRFVDFKNSYKTMDADYIESVWWVFAELFKKELIYKDSRISLFCPRCSTPLSNFEIAMSDSYKDREDPSVYLKFKIKTDKKINPPAGEEYFLVWTTTPWTLPANVALALKPDAYYLTIEKNREWLIIAEERIGLFGENPKIILRQKGEKLLGLAYEPLYKTIEQNAGKSYKTVGADFIDAKEGTGIVHIAPAFGEDDFNLARKENLATVLTLDEAGKFKTGFKELDFLEGKSFIEANDLIIGDLESRDLIFKKEKIVHSYPFCWRCETPLIYMLQPAWFVNIKKIKKKLLELNEKIDWRPKHLKKGRFGKGIAMAPDWNVSRSRFWGAPLPVWACKECKSHIVAGSLEDLDKFSPLPSRRVFLARHGLASHNIKNLTTFDWRSKEDEENNLLPKGEKEAKFSARKLEKEKIDLIISSPSLRCRQTAEIFAEELGLENSRPTPPKRSGGRLVPMDIETAKIKIEDDLHDIEMGKYVGVPREDFFKDFPDFESRLLMPEGSGENIRDLRKRIMAVFRKIIKEYPTGNILILSHGDPLWILNAAWEGIKEKDYPKSWYPKTAEFKEIKIHNRPYNNEGEVDLHRPFIDEIKLKCQCGEKAERILDVFDCWFESGSMPYAQAHYPFARLFSFPADFVAEGLDQTRGWFYTLHVLAGALFAKPAFRHVITSGIILSEKGEKLSKSKKNFPDPWLIFNRYGVDSIRYYLMISPAMQSENINFSEKDVKEVHQKIVLTLLNVLNYYQLYKKPRLAGRQAKAGKLVLNRMNVLDKWILSRLNNLIQNTTKAMDGYEITKAQRPILDFVQDLSLWYLRLSRERIKKSGQETKDALSVLEFVLLEFSKLIAPITPFLAEMIYQGVEGKKLSVHLENWPAFQKKFINKKLEENMVLTREIVSSALRARSEAGIKVRQPLASLKIRSTKHEIRNKEELLELIKQEVNVKEIIFSAAIKDEVELDTKITPELKEEGRLREVIRQIQEMRKKLGLIPSQKIEIYVEAGGEGEKFIGKYKKELQKAVGAKEIKFEKLPASLKIFDIKLEESAIKIALKT